MDVDDKVFKVAAVQMVSINNKEVNLKKAEEFIIYAAKEKARVVVLPEMFNFSGKLNQKRENAEPIPGPTINRLKDLAKKFNIYLLCGSILEKSYEKGKNIFCNTSVFLNPEGEIIAKYRKLHLFDVTLPDGSILRESELITAGNEVVCVKTSLAFFGLSICYDLRFPELYRKLAREGVQVVFIPSAFTLQTGKDHWEILVRAKAVENQFYVIAPNQIGKDTEGHRFWGKSMVVDPWGTILTKAPEKECVIFAEVDLSYQQEVRKNLPSLSHIRKDIFNF
ncbi:carbon-nitrogen hydrolase family protein [Candidatus Aerophobetes bacterium]|uniref:Carbon-nitrogen hydrolase family protein n=1 Tax=Aerophobetes bacterium TaxID=2030807 RepID=A0A662DM39_UNCAE|nr:MAG: carbon-nitrogen hydrolase family protein [Candidatus Aerophobetes bacterium]